jgi:hypothetical protein
MNDFPRTYDVLITPCERQNVAETIAGITRRVGMSLRYVADNNDGTYSVEFTISKHSDHHPNTRALIEAKFADYSITEREPVAAES